MSILMTNLHAIINVMYVELLYTGINERKSCTEDIAILNVLIRFHNNPEALKIQ